MGSLGDMVSPLMAIELGAASKMGFRLESPCAVARASGKSQFDFQVGDTNVNVVFASGKIEFAAKEDGKELQAGSAPWNAITGVSELGQSLATVPITVKHGIMRTAAMGVVRYNSRRFASYPDFAYSTELFLGLDSLKIYFVDRDLDDQNVACFLDLNQDGKIDPVSERVEMERGFRFKEINYRFIKFSPVQGLISYGPK